MRSNRLEKQLGSYRLTRELGRGGFSTVYLGRHVYLDSFAAIKILEQHLQSRDFEKFIIEARLISQLSHPNIIKIIDFGVETEDNTAFLIMDYAPGGTLGSLHPLGTQVPLELVVSYTKQIAAALQYAHDRQIIHRDVKPYNILIGSNNELLLSDFGVATMFSNSDGKEEIVGTVPYMAPERFDGHSFPASDQFALGIVVYELLCGELPFHGSFHEIAYQQRYLSFPLLKERVPTIPLAVEKVVLKALSKNPKQRFESVQKFAEALEQASLLPKPFSTGLTSRIPNQLEGIRQDVSKISFSKEREYTITSSTNAVQSDKETLKEQAPPKLALNYLISYIQDTIKRLTTILSVPIKHFFKPFRTSKQLVQGIASPAPILHPLNPSTLLLPSNMASNVPLKNFFIMYHRADRFTAEWIAWQLEEEGYSVIFPAWDFQPGSNYDGELLKATKKAERIIIILSPDYLNARSNQSKWGVVFRRDIATKQGVLLPILVRECGNELRKPLELLVFIDLVEVNEETARERLLAGVRFERSKPTTRPRYYPSSTIPTNEAMSSSSSKPTPSTPTSDFNTILIQKIVSHIETALSEKYSQIVDPNTTFAQQMIVRIETAFNDRNWASVIRKTEYLIKNAPHIISYRVYQMQGRALREQGDLLLARQAFDNALALVSEHDQQVIILEECITILASLNQWNEMLRYIKEALQLAPNESKWLALQKQAQTHLGRSREVIDVNDSLLKPQNTLVLNFTERKDQLDVQGRATLEVPLSNPTQPYPDSHVILNSIGGAQMSIEQDALQIADFLRSLRKQIIEHPEYGRIYGDAGSINQQVEQLATALTTNFQLLQEARRNNDFYPGNIFTQNAIQMHLQGLSNTILKVDSLWHQFRSGALEKTEFLIVRVEQEIPKQIEQEHSKEAEISTPESTRKDSPKQNWLKNALTGLNLFKDFLTVSDDTKKAIVQWSPSLVENFRSTLDQLGQYIGHIRL